MTREITTLYVWIEAVGFYGFAFLLGGVLLPAAVPSAVATVSVLLVTVSLTLLWSGPLSSVLFPAPTPER